jgi:hypothetical protein
VAMECGYFWGVPYRLIPALSLGSFLALVFVFVYTVAVNLRVMTHGPAARAAYPHAPLDRSPANGVRLDSLGRIEDLMKASLILALFISGTLAGGMQTAIGADVEPDYGADLVFRVAMQPANEVGHSTLVARVEKALSRYATACIKHDDRALSYVLTGFAIVEYSTAVPGRFVSVDAIAAEKCWAAGLAQRESSSAEPIWIYLTSDSNYVLVQYPVTTMNTGVNRVAQDLALIEMDGDRIARVRDYRPAPTSGEGMDK